MSKIAGNIDANIRASLFDMSEQIQASHILVSHVDAQNSSSRLTKDNALERIQDLRSQVLSGTAFFNIATEFSDCPSAEKGGALGTFGRGAMVEAFDIAAFDLEVGEVSDVVETEFGFHLIHRTG